MKKSIYFFASTLFVGGTIFTSCKSTSEKIETAEANVVKANQDLHQEELDYAAAVEQFRNETNQRIAENEKNISELKKRTETENIAIKKEHQKKIGELQTVNDNLKERINEYKDNSKDGWESFKREFNHDMDELGHALKNLTVNNEK